MLHRLLRTPFAIVGLAGFIVIVGIAGFVEVRAALSSARMSNPPAGRLLANASLMAVEDVRPALARLAPAGSCNDYVYPIIPNSAALEDNPGSWHKPVTLAALDLDPADDDLYLLTPNTIDEQSPRFRIDLDDSYWASWDGAGRSGGDRDLAAAITGAGTLGLGFSETPPPLSDPAAAALLNGILEPGDWLAGGLGFPASDEMRAALDALVRQKTLVTLPVYDSVYGNGTSIGGVRVERLIQVRLLAYSDSYPGAYFDAVLVNDSVVCTE